MLKKLISICIPTFNGEQYIEQAMDSAIAQTYLNLEIVISDDASSDRTLSIIESYKTKTEIPIYIYHHKPKGIGANWNNCFKKANGYYIKFLFQDDVLEPDCINKLFYALYLYPEASMSVSKRNFIVEGEKQKFEKWLSIFSDLQESINQKETEDYIIIDKSIFKDKNFFNSPRNKIGEPSATLIKKESINEQFKKHKIFFPAYHKTYF